VISEVRELTDWRFLWLLTSASEHDTIRRDHRCLSASAASRTQLRATSLGASPFLFVFLLSTPKQQVAPHFRQVFLFPFTIFHFNTVTFNRTVLF
jgi:hypothetical protein